MNKYGILAGAWGISTLTGVVLVATNNSDIGSAVVMISTTGSLICGLGFGINDFLRYQKSTQKISSDPIETKLDKTLSRMEKGLTSSELKGSRSNTPSTDIDSSLSDNGHPKDNTP